MKIACLQTEPKRSIKEALDEALDLASLAKNEDVNFLFLPEYCGGISSNGKLYTPPSDKENKHLFLQELRNFCKKNSVWCLIGSIAIKLDNDKIVNRSFLLNNNGEVVSKYDKIHMFDIFVNGEEHYESKTIDSGNEGVLVKTDYCKIGLSICYDIRFPNLYRKLAQEGAEVIAIPAAFTKTTGIINPWGEIIKDGGENRGLITTSIDVSIVEKYRNQLPSLQHDKKFIIKEF